ncbi:hypothetical protein K7432_006768 [Basidiobolus ranarum]|uniref:Uncharacterized protein n=1 Tax=Basidiobolus ranarum TaxID=34480 RepID=A0ABR2WUH1_9FUNG
MDQSLARNLISVSVIMSRFFITLFTLLSFSLMASGQSTAVNPQRNPFTPKNYPGLVFQSNGQNAICYHGGTIFLSKTTATCPQDVGCYGLDKDSAKISQVLKELKANGNKIWPTETSQGFTRPVDPKFSRRKNWPGKGQTARCS